MNETENLSKRPRRPGVNPYMATRDAVITELLADPRSARTISELAAVALEVKGVSPYQMAYGAIIALGQYGIVDHDRKNGTVLLNEKFASS